MRFRFFCATTPCAGFSLDAVFAIAEHQFALGGKRH